jgi:hypothetical protein
MKSPLLAVALLIAPLPALAQSAPSGFLSPSKNIACQYFADGKNADIRCDIMEATVSVPKPRDCELEWGRAFEISKTGQSGIRICHGDTIMDSKLPVLTYGQTFQRDGFTCKSEQSGVTCLNADRHGFSISRSAQSVF